MSRDEGQPAVAGAEGAGWPDEAVESGFLAEARGRGELPMAVPASAATADDTNLRPLPALNDLVGRIPPEVREALEDLFRAKFVRAQRVPAGVLKR